MTGGDGANESGQSEFERRRRARNWVLFAVLAGIAVLVYVITILRMGIL